MYRGVVGIIVATILMTGLVAFCVATAYSVCYCVYAGCYNFIYWIKRSKR